MSKKRTIYTTELKTKIVLEVLKGEKTINEIASSHNITPKNIHNWKATFLANAEMAMEPSRAVKEYKDEIDELKSKNDEYAKALGKVTIERDWAVGKLKSLDSSNKKSMIDTQAHTLSLSRQCELLHISRSSIYYTPVYNTQEYEIKKHIQKIYEEIPFYGYLKVHQQLLENEINVSANTVHKYRQQMGLKAVLAIKAPNTSLKSKEHPIHSYKLRGVSITRVNQVWSTDITYIKIKGGFVYLAAIIDWYSKAVLSYRISNTMDTDLVMSVLDEALRVYGKPEIFNTDQGSQYTSHMHTDRLRSLGVIISMNGVGRSTDNICIERFWRSAKVEKIYLNEYDRVSTLKEDVREYIEFYNNRRFHESLNYKKPMEVYRESIKANNEDFNKNFIVQAECVA
jgi:putative transposase